ncbi:hypothetical protein FACS189459_1720 [Bacilli bacterium]|nr:hypothetical protein FACS189459_1720 [Bacilli bacterium]
MGKNKILIQENNKMKSLIFAILVIVCELISFGVLTYNIANAENMYTLRYENFFLNFFYKCACFFTQQTNFLIMIFCVC